MINRENCMPQVPAAPSAAKLSGANTSVNQSVLNSFKGEIARVPLQGTYVLGLVGAAIVMVILPLIYLGAVAGVAYLTYSYAMSAGDVVSSVPSSGRRGSRSGAGLALFAFITPIIIGGVLTLFMLRPLLHFFTMGGNEQRRKLAKNTDPLLYAFIEKVCKTMGAPMPAEIQVDCHANASASFKSGVWGLLTNQLVLTIGLPLAGGLSLREFAGVMAHELGHFSQPIAMRAIYIINTVNQWFAIAVYARSGQNMVKIGGELAQAHYSLLLIYLASCFFVWITRGSLWVLMTIGHAVSSYMMRQMEFNADQYEAAVAGSDGFEATVKKLQTMNVATSMAFDSLSSSWAEGKLPDSLPILIQNKAKDVTPRIQEELKKRQLREQTSLFDSHPADQDRILAVRRSNMKGIVVGEMPARVLFRDFTAVSRLTTLDFYKDALGDEFTPASVRPVEDVLHKEKSDEEGVVILRKYFQADISPVRGLRIHETVPKPPQDIEAARAQVAADRERALTLAPAYRDALKNILEGDSRLLKGEVALELIRYAIPVIAKDYDIATPDKDGAAALIGESHRRIDAANPICQEYETLCGQRLVNVARLLASPEVAKSIPMGQKFAEETADLLPMAHFFGDLMPVLSGLQDKFHMTLALLEGLQGREENSSYCSRVEVALREMHAVLEQIYGMLGDTVYPFDHQNGVVTMRHYALRTVPGTDVPRKLLEVADNVTDRLYETHYRILARLALIAQDFENEMGLKPLPEPAESDKKGQLSRLRELQQSGTVPVVSVPPPPPPPVPGRPASATIKPAAGAEKPRPKSNTAIRF